MKNHQKIIIRFLSVITLSIFSCSRQDDADLLNKHDQHSQEVLDYITSLGFSPSTIVDSGDAFVAEGDIAFPKNMIVPASGSIKNGRVSQYYCNTLVNVAHAMNVRVMVDPSMNAQSAEITAAINLWNNAGANIHFSITTGTHDILISNVNLGSGVCGRGDFPLNGLPGANVSININEVAADNFDQRMINIAHELGHCIGLWHTNDDSGSVTLNGHNYSSTSVPGWGGSDASSIMLGGTCHQLSTQLSAKDKGALAALYRDPQPKNVQIQISSQFVISWSSSLLINENVTGYQVSYGGFSGINFGADITVSPTTYSYTVPNVSPYPTSGSTTTGGIQATIRAVYAGAVVGAPTVTRTKSGGVWQ